MAARVQITRSSAASRRILQQFSSRSVGSSTLYSLTPRQRLSGLNREVTAFAIAIPRRHYATETSSSQTSGGSGPPPGFNLDEAKKPLPKESSKQEASEVSATPTIEELKKSKEVLTAPGAAKPSDVPPTAAVEASTLTELAAKKAKEEEKENALAKAGGPKKTLWQKIKHEVQHYYDGYVLRFK
jgi:LETM1 and EF-hand domain-containing protein 1, mitochondrial